MWAYGISASTKGKGIDAFATYTIKSQSMAILTGGYTGFNDEFAKVDIMTVMRTVGDGTIDGVTRMSWKNNILSVTVEDDKIENVRGLMQDLLGVNLHVIGKRC